VDLSSTEKQAATSVTLPNPIPRWWLKPLVKLKIMCVRQIPHLLPAATPRSAARVNTEDYTASGLVQPRTPEI